MEDHIQQCNNSEKEGIEEEANFLLLEEDLYVYSEESIQCNANAEGDEVRKTCDNQPITERNSGISTTEAFISTGLLEYLKKKSIGKEILKAYAKCQKDKTLLPKTVRSKLYRLVIEREKDWQLRTVNETNKLESFVITKERFITLSNEIAYLFKGENPATYYTPFIKEGDFIVYAKGKLWNNYNYTKDCLRQADLLKTRELKRPLYTATEKDFNRLNWLSSHVEPWHEVESVWEHTFEARQEFLKNQSTSVQDYIGKFECLKIQRGKQMYISDFSKLYPEVKYLTHEQWNVVRGCLKKHYSSLKLTSILDMVLVQTLLSDDLTEEKQNFLTLYLLPFLIPSKRIVKRKKKSLPETDDAENQRPHRLSLEERRERYILHVETSAEIQPRLLLLKEKLLLTKKTFQPLIIAVGPVTNIEALYVAVNEQLYAVDTIINAFELALAIFFSLDCKYPENCESLWSFIQRLLTRIELKTDVLNVQSNVILGHVKDLGI